MYQLTNDWQSPEAMGVRTDFFAAMGKILVDAAQNLWTHEQRSGKDELTPHELAEKGREFMVNKINGAEMKYLYLYRA